VIAGTPGSLDQFLDDLGRGRDIGVAEPEIDDVLAAAACLGFQVIDCGEDVRREVFDAAEVDGALLTGRG